MDKNRISGIYCWTGPNGKRYIGQSIDLAARKTSFLAFGGSYTSDKSKIDAARKRYPNEKCWNSAEEASVALFGSPRKIGINKCRQGKQNQAYGFKWEYAK